MGRQKVCIQIGRGFMLKSNSELPMPERTGSFTPVPIDESQSGTIKIARVLCIAFMMTTHAWPGSDRILAADVPAAFHVFYVIVVDSLGRASVPLLSVISGLLLFQSLQNTNAASVISGKIQTLIIPMVFWSLPLVVIMLVEPYVKNSPAPNLDFMDWVNLFFAVTDGPANGPLHFFREIFIMSIYGAIVFWVWRINRIAATCTAIAIALLEQIPGGFLLFRNQIAAMYIFGFLLAGWGQARWKPKWALSAACLLFYVLFQLFAPTNPEEQGIIMQRFWEVAPRAAMAMVMWRISASLLEVHSVGPKIMALEPHIFVIFCNHIIVVKFVALIALFLGWSELSEFYPFILMGQITLFIAVGFFLSLVLTPLPLLRGKKMYLRNPAVAGQRSD